MPCPIKKAFALVLLFLSSATVYAQLHVCIDPALAQPGSAHDQKGVYFASYKWTPGTSIRVKFLGGNEGVKSKIRNVVKEWEQYANVKFNFVDMGESDIRIAFVPTKGAYSKIGTMALSVPQHQETMNFGWFNSSTPDDEIKRTTLHEFGHALGLMHEHQNPLSPIKWNYQKAYAYYMQVLGWSKQAVDFNIFQRYSVNQTNNEFDSESIMIYPIPGELTADGFSVGWNYSLSQKDKKLIAEMYPFTNKYLPTHTETVTTTTSTSLKAASYIKNINVQHNVFRNGKKGMLISTDFTILNARDREGWLVARVYYNNGKVMRSSTQTPDYTMNGNVSAFTFYKPGFDYTNYNQVALFLPYEELNVSLGENKLKFSVHVLDENKNELTESGNYFFTYQNGPVYDYKQIGFDFNDGAQRLIIKPSFIITYAQNVSHKVAIHFIGDDGLPLKAKPSSTNRDANGNLVVYADIKPCCEITHFNIGPGSEYHVWISYSELPLKPGTNKLRFYMNIVNADGLTVLDGSNTQVGFEMTVQ